MMSIARFGLAFIVLAPGMPVAASTFGVTTQYFVKTTGPDEVTHTLNETLQPAAPVQHVATSGNFGVPFRAFVDLQTRAFYGTLGFQGRGRADQPIGENGTISVAQCLFSCAPLVQFFDEIVVRSSMFAPGSMVNLAVQFNLIASANFTQTLPDSASFANAGGFYQVDNSTHSAPTSNALITLGTGVFSTSQSITARLGDRLQIRGGLFGNGQAGSLSAAGPSTFDFFASGAYFIQPQPGVFLQSASGHSYYSNSVPEPASWVLLIAGFGMIGALARRLGVRPVVD